MLRTSVGLVITPETEELLVSRNMKLGVSMTAAKIAITLIEAKKKFPANLF